MERLRPGIGPAAPASPNPLRRRTAGPLEAPALESGDRPLPINLPTALRLANVQAVDVVAAAERLNAAFAVLDQARVQWLPTITLGGDYYRHDGKIQNSDGSVTDNSHSSWMYGAGSGIGAAAILSPDDAIFGALIAKQTVRARQADLQAARNDTLVAVTDAYFNVQQARGELAGAMDARRRAEELVRRTKELQSVSGLAPGLEVVRAQAEVARRQQTELQAREQWQLSSADLLRILRLDPAARVEPVEPPHLRIDVVPPGRCVDDLIAFALLNRPELASQKAQVEATLALLKQERLRPLIPSVLIRGASTPVTGTLAVGQFSGGSNGSPGNTGSRGDIDVQLLWQLNNLGLGNLALVRQRQAENRSAVVELFRVQDRVAAETVQAFDQVRMAARRADVAADGVRLARDSADKNIEGLRQPDIVGGKITLLVRPEEAVASIEALYQAYIDYYTAVTDYDRGQFRLYHALGHPAQRLADDDPTAPAAAPPPPAGGRQEGGGAARVVPLTPSP